MPVRVLNDSDLGRTSDIAERHRVRGSERRGRHQPQPRHTARAGLPAVAGRARRARPGRRARRGGGRRRDEQQPGQRQRALADLAVQLPGRQPGVRRGDRLGRRAVQLLGLRSQVGGRGRAGALDIQPESRLVPAHAPRHGGLRVRHLDALVRKRRRMGGHDRVRGGRQLVADRQPDRRLRQRRDPLGRDDERCGPHRPARLPDQLRRQGKGARGRPLLDGHPRPIWAAATWRSRRASTPTASSRRGPTASPPSTATRTCTACSSSRPNSSGTADGVYVDNLRFICRASDYDADSYFFNEGTSMATPHVSGVAALVRAAVPDATAAQVAQAIREGAVPLPSLAGKTVTGGRADAPGAIAAARRLAQRPPASPPPGDPGGPAPPQGDRIAPVARLDRATLRRRVLVPARVVPERERPGVRDRARAEALGRDRPLPSPSGASRGGQDAVAGAGAAHRGHDQRTRRRRQLVGGEAPGEAARALSSPPHGGGGGDLPAAGRAARLPDVHRDGRGGRRAVGLPDRVRHAVEHPPAALPGRHLGQEPHVPRGGGRRHHGHPPRSRGRHGARRAVRRRDRRRDRQVRPLRLARGARRRAAARRLPEPVRRPHRRAGRLRRPHGHGARAVLRRGPTRTRRSSASTAPSGSTRVTRPD